MQIKSVTRCLLFDWGDTLMRVFPEFDGPMAAWPRVEAMPFANEILADLHLRYGLALATNAADSEETEIRAALDRVGLGKLLDKVYCYRNIGHKKPSKEFFDYVLADLGIEQSQVGFEQYGTTRARMKDARARCIGQFTTCAPCRRQWILLAASRPCPLDEAFLLL
jgi:hypothetical protein